jgi:hypothetical protein
MAVGTVSGINPDDTWQLITSTTISSGTASYNYNSIAGYKTILIVGNNIVKSAAEYMAIQFNGNTSVGSYSQVTQQGTNSFFYMTGNSATSAAHAFVVYNVNQAVPHKVDVAYSTQAGGANQYYTDPTAITSIQVFLSGSGATFTSGTIYVYGIAA